MWKWRVLEQKNVYDESHTVSKREKGSDEVSENDGSGTESGNDSQDYDAEMLIGAKVAAAKKAVEDPVKSNDDTIHAKVLDKME